MAKPYIPFWRSDMKRSSCQATPPKKGTWVCPDDSFKEKYPSLAQGLCDIWWDDGKPREPFSLTIRFTDLSVRLSLVDSGASQSVYTEADTLEGALGALDAALGGETCTWRKWKRK